VNVWCF
jgi:hypothetical protein